MLEILCMPVKATAKDPWMLRGNLLVTARQQSCGKVMCSVVCLSFCLFTMGEGPHVTITHDSLDLPVQGPRASDLEPPGPSLAPWYWHLVAITRDLFKRVSFRTPSRLWSKYGLQMGGTHPTGMLSCYILSLWSPKAATNIWYVPPSWWNESLHRYAMQFLAKILPNNRSLPQT